MPDRESDEDPVAVARPARPVDPGSRPTTTWRQRSAALDDDHREALERLVGGEATPSAIRDAAVKGRINGTMESIALVLTDASLADCIEKLGDHADNPTTEQLREVLPGIVERHGLAITRMMLASTVAGEAAAANVIRDLLKHDDLVKLPARSRARSPRARRARATRTTPSARRSRPSALEARKRKQEEAAHRREQSARDRGRVSAAMSTSARMAARNSHRRGWCDSPVVA